MEASVAARYGTVTEDDERTSLHAHDHLISAEKITWTRFGLCLSSHLSTSSLMGTDALVSRMHDENAIKVVLLLEVPATWEGSGISSPTGSPSSIRCADADSAVTLILSWLDAIYRY